MYDVDELRAESLDEFEYVEPERLFESVLWPLSLPHVPPLRPSALPSPATSVSE